MRTVTGCAEAFTVQIQMAKSTVCPGRTSREFPNRWTSTQSRGEGLGEGLGLGDGLVLGEGLGEGLVLGDGLGDGLVLGDGLGEGLVLGDGLGDGLGEVLGLGVGVGLGLATGVLLALARSFVVLRFRVGASAIAESDAAAGWWAHGPCRDERFGRAAVATSAKPLIEPSAIAATAPAAAFLTSARTAVS